MKKWSRHCSKYHINQMKIKWRSGADTAQNTILTRWKSNEDVDQTLLKILYYPDENQMEKWSRHCSKYHITQMKIKWRSGEDTVQNIILTRWKSNEEVEQTLLKILYHPDENQLKKWSRHCSKYYITQMKINWRSGADTLKISY
jgi:hypothetical protein